MNSQSLVILAAVLGCIGLAMLIHFCLKIGVDIIRGGSRRIRAALTPRWSMLSQALDNERKIDVVEERPYGDALRSILHYPAPILVGGILGLLVRDWLLSPVMLVLGFYVTEMLFHRIRRLRWRRLTSESEMLITQFASRYPIRNSVALALEESTPLIPHGALKEAAMEAVQRLRIGQHASDAFAPFEKIPHPVPRRLAKVMAQAGIIDKALFQDLLNRLKVDTASQRDLQNRIRSDLTVVSVTTTILQTVLGISMVATSLLPSWREYFISDIPRRLLFIVISMAGLTGSLYVENEFQMIEESS
jgi:hypothetical protein